jgi:hypothetical protein
VKLAAFVPPETDIVQMILRWLEVDRRVTFCVRLNSGAMVDARGQFLRFYQVRKLAQVAAAKGRMDIVSILTASNGRSIKNPGSGLPDIWGLLWCGLFFAIEVKRPGWKKPTDDRERLQAFVLELVRESGGIAGFVTCLDEVRALFGGVGP